MGVFLLGPLKPLFYIDLIPYLGYHFTLFAQYAADILPLAILDACRAWNDLRRAAYDADSPVFFGEPVTPCCPNLISFVRAPSLASTAWDLVGWLGVFLGLLYPAKVSEPRLIATIVVLAY